MSRRGEFAAVVGPSGCGKSSLMKLVTGLMPPDSGEIVIFGDTGARPGEDRRHGVPESEPAALAQGHRQRAAAARDRAAASQRSSARARRNIASRLMALLETVGLDGFGERYPWELSGGMQQRVSLCRALIHQPALLMLDEPFAALDAFTREELWCVLRDLWQQIGFTVILVTHDLREATFLADTIHVMSARPGRIVLIETDRPAAPARSRHLLRAALHRHRARTARQDRRGSQGMSAQGMSSIWKRSSPWLFTIGAVRRSGSSPAVSSRSTSSSCRRRRRRSTRWCSTGGRCCATRSSRCGRPWRALPSRSLSASSSV